MATAYTCSDPLPAGLAAETIEVAAPFPMPPIQVPDFSAAPRFCITDYGASPDDKTATRRAIAAAIDAAHQAGAGVVVVPPGVWLTGPIHLKSHVNLHLHADAVLLFSEDPQDYLPAVATSWEGIECYNYSPLVYAYDAEYIAISGSGKLKAKLDIWTQWYQRPPAHLAALVALYQMGRLQVPVEQRQMAVGENHLRPHFIHFNRCRHVLIEDIAIEDSPFWVVHPYLCRDVAIRRIRVRAHGHNNDGVDPEMSQNVLIEDCVFDQGDDAISIKSGRDFDAWRLHTPSKNIVMRHCQINNGHHLLAVGSELSGGVENVLIEFCRFVPAATDSPGSANTAQFLPGAGETSVTDNNLLYIKTNERRGGYVKNITMRHIIASIIGGGALSIETDVLYQWRSLTPTYQRALTAIEGIRLLDIRIERATFLCFIQAQAEQPACEITLTDIQAGWLAGEAITTENVRDFSFNP